MAFCQFCGKEVAEGEACGCEKEREVMKNETAEVEAASESGADAVESKPLNSKTVVIVAALVAAVLFITLFIMLIVSIGSGGYKKPIEKFVKAINKYDAELLVDAALTDKMLRYLDREENMDYDDVCEQYDDMIDLLIEEWEDEYGDNVKLSVKFDGKYKLDEDEIEDIEDDYKRIGCKVKIEKAYEVECTFKIKGEDDKDEDDVDLIVIKVEDEGWKLYTGSLNDIL